MLSVIVPGIRVLNWQKLYTSIKKAYSGEWEIIFIGPYAPIDKMGDNVKYIHSLRHPNACQQIGLIESTGDYIMPSWDDGTYRGGSIDKAFSLLQPNSAVAGKYTEGDIAPAYMADKKYWFINTHSQAYSPYVPDDFIIFNTGIVSREKLIELGGFDCRYEATALGFIDLSIRMQLSGVKVILMEEVMMDCSWLPGTEGDHGPIHEAMEEHDFSLLHKMYRQPVFHKRMKIDINNWKEQPEIWERRFK